MTERQLKNRIEKYYAIKNQIEELKTQLESVTDELKNEVGSNDFIVCNEYKINYPIIVSTKIDSTRLKKENIDLYKQYSMETITRRFTITTPKDLKKAN